MIMSKKRGKSIKININFSNRLLYTLILIGILIAIGVGVYAATSFPASGAGHNLNELAQPCDEGKILKVVGGAWTCGDDVGITQAYADLNYKDPPGQWTCIARSGSGSSNANAYCVGLEKVITGGCRYATCSGQCLTGWPITNGWSCHSEVSGTITAYAYCCL
jgi:hypothetical protein